MATNLLIACYAGPLHTMVAVALKAAQLTRTKN